MSHVEVRDHALWAKHIRDNDTLKDKIIGLPAGTLIELVVDGVRGTWMKMDDGRDEAKLPTPGLKGIGVARKHWHALQNRRGDVVTIREAEQEP